MRKKFLNKLHIISTLINIKNFFKFSFINPSPNKKKVKRNMRSGTKAIETTSIENLSKSFILTPSVKNLACEYVNIPEITKEIEIIDPKIANSFGSNTLDR